MFTIAADRIVNMNTRSFLKKLIHGSYFPIITGSFVYKTLIRNERSEDIDIFYNLLRKNFYYAEHSYGTGIDEHVDSQTYKVRFLGALQPIKIDALNAEEIFNKIGSLTPVNSLVYTKDGIKHILEFDEIKELVTNLDLDPIKERTWMIDNFKNGRYCKWNDMREKDVEYFSTFDVIDCSECEKHGIFYNK